MRAITFEKLLDSKEVAKILGMSKATVQRWAARGWLPSIKLPGGRGRFKFDPSDIETFLKRRTSGKL
jgi:excisionase family DNA binding protein